MSKNLARFLKSLNNEKRELVREILESPIKWDLINFYQANPFSIHTARGLSRIVGRKADQVFREIEELVVAGILKNLSGNGDSSSIYIYEPSNENASTIRTLIDFGKEREQLENLRQLVKSS